MNRKKTSTSKKEKPIDIVHKVVKEELKKGTIKVETRVKDVMSKGVKTVRPKNNLREVIELFSEYRISGAPVMKKDKIVGLISQTDVMKTMETKHIFDPKKDEIKLPELERITVDEIMTKKPIMIDQDETIADASDSMSKHDVNRLLVVDKKNKLVGIVSREDIIKAMTVEFFVKSVQMKGDMIIKTDIDDFLSIIKERKIITIKDLSKKMNIEPRQTEEWAKLLEERGLIEIEYPAFGPPRLRWKDE